MRDYYVCFVKRDKIVTSIWNTYEEIVAKYDGRGAENVENIGYFAFYDEVMKDRI